MNMVQILEQLHSFITQPILFAALGLLCVIFGISSFILMYHWDHYAVDKSSIITAQLIYYVGGIAIIFIAFISIILY